MDRLNSYKFCGWSVGSTVYIYFTLGCSCPITPAHNIVNDTAEFQNTLKFSKGLCYTRINNIVCLSQALFRSLRHLLLTVRDRQSLLTSGRLNLVPQIQRRLFMSS